MKLYYSTGSCSLSAHIALKESGLPHELILVNLKTHTLKDGTDFFSINPLGYVPLLELENGQRLTEGPAITQYIADQAPEKNLAPANGTFERALLQSKLNFISTELHKNFGPLFKPDSTAEEKQKSRQLLTKRFAHINALLGEADYLTGNQFSIADGYLFTVTKWANLVQLDLNHLENLQAFQKRIATRPAVQEALKAEGLLK